VVWTCISIYFILLRGGRIESETWKTRNIFLEGDGTLLPLRQLRTLRDRQNKTIEPAYHSGGHRHMAGASRKELRKEKRQIW
jgi:hypothetical protein